MRTVCLHPNIHVSPCAYIHVRVNTVHVHCSSMLVGHSHACVTVCNTHQQDLEVNCKISVKKITTIKYGT